MLEAGVRIFEYERATLHAKTLVIDAHACLIGSSNLDFRSFWLNAECNVLMFDDDCGAALEGNFREDLSTSREITAEEWSRRTLFHHVMDSTARALRWAL